MHNTHVAPKNIFSLFYQLVGFDICIFKIFNKTLFLALFKTFGLIIVCMIKYCFAPLSSFFSSCLFGKLASSHRVMK